MTPITPRQFITKVAQAFPDAPEIQYFGDDVFGLEWEHEGLVAGAWSGPDGAGVHLAEANADVTTVKDAIHLLREIFSDRVVARAGFAGPRMEYCVLTPFDAVGSPLAHRDVSRSAELPWIDGAWTRTWSGKGDKGGPPEWTAEPEHEPEPRETPGFWSLFFEGKKY